MQGLHGITNHGVTGIVPYVVGETRATAEQKIAHQP
jgi:hypothetical protein